MRQSVSPTTFYYFSQTTPDGPTSDTRHMHNPYSGPTNTSDPIQGAEVAGVLEHHHSNEECNHSGEDRSDLHDRRSIVTTRARGRAPSFLSEVRALWSSEDAAVGVGNPQENTVRPSEASLNRVLAAAAGRVNVSVGELLEHLLQRHVNWSDSRCNADLGVLTLPVLLTL